MSLQINAVFQPSQTVYVEINDLVTGNVWNTGTQLFEAYNSAHWAQYAVPLVERAGTGFYTAPYPSGIVGVLTSEVLYQQGGGSPALGDTPITTLFSQGVNLAAIAGSLSAAINLSTTAQTAQQGAAATGTLSKTQATTNLSQVLANFYVGRTLLWTSGVLAGAAAAITGYAASGGLLTFTPLAAAPSAGDSFIIL
jgi:hypothetical protein